MRAGVRRGRARVYVHAFMRVCARVHACMRERSGARSVGRGALARRKTQWMSEFFVVAVVVCAKDNVTFGHAQIMPARQLMRVRTFAAPLLP
jgi:hypothetical protein